MLLCSLLSGISFGMSEMEDGGDTIDDHCRKYNVHGVPAVHLKSRRGNKRLTSSRDKDDSQGTNRSGEWGGEPAWLITLSDTKTVTPDPSFNHC